MAIEERLVLVDRKSVLAELRKELRECRKDADEFGGENILWAEGIEFAIDTVKGAAKVDAVEVVHGEWFIDDRNKAERTCVVECSVCGAILNLKMFDFGMNYNYCPNCGARMDGGNANGQS